jgi:hypothetical protein
MDPLLVMFGGLVLIFAIGVLALENWHPRRPRRMVGGSLHSDASDAEIESHDIDQMIDAQNDMRRRAGRPSIGDELERQVRKER